MLARSMQKSCRPAQDGRGSHVFLATLLLCVVVLVALVRRRNGLDRRRLSGTVARRSSLLAFPKLKPRPVHTVRMSSIRASVPSPFPIAYCVRATVAGKACVMQIDTGYAGPPVLSLSYAGLLERSSAAATVQAEYKRAVSASAASTSASQRRAFEGALRSGRCVKYTSGCTMRLMGIGSVVDQQADLMLCHSVSLEPIAEDGGDDDRESWVDVGAEDRPRAQVFVTHSLPRNPHIATCDFLFHMGGALLRPHEEKVLLGPGLLRHATSEGGGGDASPFLTCPMELAGGAPVVRLHLDDVQVRLTVDTGAPGPICVGTDVARRLRGRCISDEHHFRQSGVNNEAVCSDAIVASGSLLGRDLGDVLVLVNDLPVAMTDGYVGLAFLSAFEVLLDESTLAFRPIRGREPARRSEDVLGWVSGSCPGRRPWRCTSTARPVGAGSH